MTTALMPSHQPAPIMILPRNPHAAYLRFFDFDAAEQAVYDHCATLGSERHKENTKRDGLTLKSYRRDLSRFRAWLDARQSLPVASVMQSYLATIGHLKPASIQRYMAPIHRFIFELANQPFQLDTFESTRDYLQCIEYQKSMTLALKLKNPTPQQSSLAPLDRHGVRVSQAEASSILAQIDTSTLAGLRDKALLLTAFVTGLRINALARITLESLTQHSSTTWTVKVLDKRGKDDPVAIDTRAVRAIQAYVTAFNAAYPDRAITKTTVIWRNIDRWGKTHHKPIQQGGLRDIMQKYPLMVGIRMSPHDYRRTWAAWARELKMDRKHAQRQMKHESFGTTDGYMGEEQNYNDFNIALLEGFTLL